MAHALRVLVFNEDAAFSPELRSRLFRIPGLKIVAELDEPSLLPQAVGQFPVDLVFVHLDPSVDFNLEIIRQLMDMHPGTVVFALSEHTDGDVVLRALRAGVREFLVKPLTDEDLTRAMAKIEPGAACVAKRGKLISVIGSSGGVGATSLAANLAVELSTLIAKPDRVAVVDLDFRFGQVATMLDVQAQFTVADLCESPEHIEAHVLEKALVKHPCGVLVLARPNSFQQADAITAAHCASVLTALTEMCDYVVVDGPSRYDPGGQSVIDAADFNLLVIQLLVTSVRNADRMCRELAQQGFQLDRVQLVCNRMDADPGFLDAAQVEKTIGRPMFATIPDDWRSVSASINIGQPLATQWARSRVRQAVVSLATKIHSGREPDDPNKGGGLFGRILSSVKKTKPSSAAPAATAS